MKIPATALALLLAAAIGSAAESGRQGTAPASEKLIRVHARELIVDIEADTAEFSGDVHIERGVMSITADYVKLHFMPGQEAADIGELDDSAIEKIEARGHVLMLQEGTRARSDTAVYDPQTETLVLEGAGTTVTRGASTIEGDRIELNASQGRLTVHGGGSGRVKAVIATGSGLF